MRKRILSTLLALCLALSLLPASALAAGEGRLGAPLKTPRVVPPSP